MTLLIVVIVFGGMVFIHEFGHFLAARFFKIEVEEFGFGFPPKLLTLFKWQGTEFTLNALPIGGFVRPKGENDPNVMDGLAAANPWKRLGVLFAGPLMNLLTAVVVTFFLIAQTGVSVEGKVLIENVSDSSPAQQGGIKPNDVLLAVNGTPVTTLDQARTLIHAGIDTPLELTLDRAGQTVKLSVTPLSSRPAEQGALGVGLGYPRRAATIAEIVSGGFVYTGAQAASILYIPVGLIQGAIAPGEARLIGLKGIYDIFSQAVQRDVQTRQPSAAAPITGTGQAPQSTTEPTNYILSLVAMLSVSLAVFNLLPIPALDGGRILFTLPEILFRRRIPYKLENVINGVAMLLLIALMVFVNAMDFINPSNIKLP
jgi:regulator of sigma E protease